MTEQQFDVFLAHSSKDKPSIRQIYRELKQRGLRPWLDEEEIVPGAQFQDEIQRAIGTVKAAAIFIGEDLGKWQEFELRALIQRCVSKSVRIIPVLLPGIESIPEDEYFLSQYQFVKFGETLQNQKAFDLLEWGITGVKPQNLDSVSLPDAQDFSNKATVSLIREIDRSKILYIKNIKHPSGIWAYRLEGVRSGQQPIFELMWRRNGRGVGLPKAGDLMILHQQAKVTHVVEFLDDALREEDFGVFRRVKAVWMPNRQDWHQLPHQREVLGFNPRYSDGNTHALQSRNFKTFQEAWKQLSDFQIFVVEQLQKLDAAQS
ncbi:toll/interleukin-1 receptor domain-containing protein [Halomicronema sp. CCY15110]|uniref:toll/interleukin-1 receptor domain-containing protein n=1 Tax=Halomicronema sp. CCY15110 TaxID=2767773 RepID=UPI00194E3E8A|nr:toll/interleukin-1 receptor domain-containing protein [Halomicronema sp. CCY15110]